jgi:hypothetical protein
VAPLIEAVSNNEGFWSKKTANANWNGHSYCFCIPPVPQPTAFYTKGGGRAVPVNPIAPPHWLSSDDEVGESSFASVNCYLLCLCYQTLTFCFLPSFLTLSYLTRISTGTLPRKTLPSRRCER